MGADQLREAVTTLGGVSNKEQKAWRTAWDSARAESAAPDDGGA